MKVKQLRCGENFTTETSVQYWSTCMCRPVFVRRVAAVQQYDVERSVNIPTKKKSFLRFFLRAKVTSVANCCKTIMAPPVAVSPLIKVCVNVYYQENCFLVFYYEMESNTAFFFICRLEHANLLI